MPTQATRGNQAGIYLPPGIDFHALEQKQKEKMNPGGAWVDGWYIEPGLNFSGFGGQDVQGANQSRPINPLGGGEGVGQTGTGPTITSIGGPADIRPIKSPEQLKLEAQQAAMASVDTNPDYLEGTAGLQRRLGETFAAYDQDTNFARTNYDRSDLELERNRGISRSNLDTNLADRGLSYGGVGVKEQDTNNENFDIRKVNNQGQLQQLLSQIQLNRGNAQSQFEDQRLALRRSVIDKLINDYYQRSLAPISGGQ